MIDLFSVKQAGSHESYVGDINTKAKLVIGAFEDVDRPGYIKTDDLIKVVYMNGLDQVLFERCISKLVEDFPKATAEEAMQLCQEFSLDRGHSVVSGAAASFNGKLFVADDLIAASANVSIPVRKSGKAINPNYIPNLPAWPVNSKWCQFCWSRGFKNEHVQSTCAYYQRSLAKLPRQVASDLKPSAHVAVHTLASDRLLIEKYESDYHSNYVSAYGRFSAGADSYVANSAIPGSFFSSLEDSFAFAALHSSVSWWYDNCASVSIVDAMSKLSDHETLSIPFRIGGIVGGIVVTHRGYIPFLPRSVGLAYFSSEATACLISLGYVQSRGGSYRSVGLSKLAICAPGGAVIDIADIGPNRLPAVSSRLLSTVVPPSVSTRVKDSAVRPRPVPFRLSTSGPISLAKSSLRVSKSFVWRLWLLLYWVGVLFLRVLLGLFH